MRRDLPLVGSLALAGLLVALSPSPDWLRAVFLLPLALFLPGYALAANVFPAGGIGGAERCVYAVVLSIAVAAVGGLLIQVPLNLSREVWALTLAGVTIAAAARGTLKLPRAAAGPDLSAAWPRPLALVLLLAATGLAVVAVVSATNGLHEAQAKIRFTSFWMLPASTDGGMVSVGIRNHEGRRAHYRVELQRSGRTFRVAKVALKAGEAWEQPFAVGKGPADVPVRAELSREGTPYRYLELAVPR
jgi:uncharacterized membrane protein